MGKSRTLYGAVAWCVAIMRRDGTEFLAHSDDELSRFAQFSTRARARAHARECREHNSLCRVVKVFVGVVEA